MDDAVDQKYRKKHFPPSYFASKPTNVNPSNNAPSAVPSTAKPALDGPPQSINDLISSFVGLSITPAPPEIEGTPPWPCPIAALPDEILIKVLTELAILDILSFVRCAQVCKVFAFFVSNEEQIWKRVCLGSEVGFGGMHYTWQTEVDGGHLLEDNTEVILDQAAPASVQASIVNTVPTANTTTPPAVIQAADTLVAPATAAVAATIPVALPNITTTLLISLYSSSYRLMFRNRPRIRFNGCYISTVNYIRPGQAAPSQLTWGSPVHIVTYYRYLRFFRNGTVISLLTTSEPTEIVHVLTPTLLDSRPGPTSLVHNALRGRWRLSSVADDPTKSLAQAEGMVFVETEGVGENYVYRMELDIKAVGKTTKSNRLVWKGFWCYNKLTDDWGEFGLRNDKAFVFSRVRRYGTGA
jgi:F-box protein 9